jgi:hypothetical protein
MKRAPRRKRAARRAKNRNEKIFESLAEMNRLATMQHLALRVVLVSQYLELKKQMDKITNGPAKRSEDAWLNRITKWLVQ